MEGESGLEHRSDVEILTHPPDPLTNASYVREVKWTVGGLSSSLGGLAAEAERMMEQGNDRFPQKL